MQFVRVIISYFIRKTIVYYLTNMYEKRNLTLRD